VLSDVEVPQKLLLGGEPSRMCASRKAQIIPEREVVPLNQQVVFEIAYVAAYFLLLSTLLGNSGIRPFEAQQPNLLHLVDGGSLDLADEFAAFDVE
jgi:hypothetical protein